MTGPQKEGQFGWIDKIADGKRIHKTKGQANREEANVLRRLLYHMKKKGVTGPRMLLS